MTQTDRTLVLTANVREELLSHAREGARESPPAEVCGVLVGTSSGEDGDRVRSTLRIANVADAPRTAYELDPAETMDAVDAVEAAGDDVVGFYHSHPESRARPSATDRARATWTGYVYLIVGLGPDDPEVRAWRWTGSDFDPLSVRVE